ncbi:hypothetical protein JA1_002221 [Spathaspora sp. JA1]|nr:hypothetical protein JA1_002221 [Spathaspora sp. JA1]
MKHRENLFDDGQDSPIFHHGNGFPNDNKSHMLFGDANSSSTIPVTTTSSGSSGAATTMEGFNALGGNLHNLKSSQINKIIAGKYHGDSILLIRQLSLDLAKKERELIIQRQENFNREQKLYKLCNEFGNLSTLEIDQKLSQDKVPHVNSNDKVDEILSDLIQSAISDEIVKPQVLNTRPRSSSPIAKSSRIELLRTNSQGAVKPIPKKNWLKNLFGSTDDLPQTGSTTAKSTHETTLAPVELVNFGRTPSMLSLIDNQDANIDKYGFFTDKSNVRITRASTISHPPTARSNPSPPSMNNAILIGNDRKSKYIDKLKQISKIHDSVNLKVERDWDNLMKSINLQSYKLDPSSSDVMVQLGTFGVNLIKLDGNDDNIYNWFINLTQQYGIPQKYRRLLWMELSGANNIKINGIYEELRDSSVTNNTDNIQLNINQINLDLHRTLPFNYFFNNLLELKPGPNFYKLQRILYAFVKYCPGIGYVQGMNKIVGTLLLSTLDEEEIFWIFVALCEEILPKYDQQSFFNSIGLIHKDNLILKQVYLEKFLPRLNQHLNKLGGLDIDFITMNWWLTLFIDLKFFDLDSWFKIFDNMLIIDSQEEDDNHSCCKFISLTLAILKCLEPTLLNLNDKESIYIYLSSDNNYHQDSTTKYTNVKFSELMKHHLAISKKISSKELKQLRDNNYI